ncbi:hypothetical protein ABZP36_021833 [Zizania latifolia]
MFSILMTLERIKESDARLAGTGQRLDFEFVFKKFRCKIWVSARILLDLSLDYSQGFRKVDPDRWEFAHTSFLRGQTHLLRNIVRRGSAAAAGGGAGKRRDASADGADDDMTMVATEVVRLKQAQRIIDDRVAAMWRRAQETERRPKQLLAFLLKVVGDRDRLHRLVGGGDAAGAAAAVDGGLDDFAPAEGGEKRARLLPDGDMGGNSGSSFSGLDLVDFTGFYSGADAFADLAVDAAAGPTVGAGAGDGCSFAFGVDKY